MMDNDILNVTAARHVRDHVLWLRFSDGAEGHVDLADHLQGQVFEPLKSVTFFAQVILDPETRTVAWPNGADIAPEYLHGLLQPHEPARFKRRRLRGKAMKRPANQLAICINDVGYTVSLDVGRIYRVLTDARAAKDGLVRVVDESGEDYLFDRERFVYVSIPAADKRRILAALRRRENGPEVDAARTALAERGPKISWKQLKTDLGL
ncbi:MAG: DUF2442 domain-containing protein [Gemmatimonadota bacterium]